MAGLMAIMYNTSFNLMVIFNHARFSIHFLCLPTLIMCNFFFFIGNITFIEKMNIMFMMMNTLDMKKIHKVQELKLTDCRKQKLKYIV